MKRHSRKTIILLIATIAAIMVTAGAVSAATRVDWSVNYLKGAPSGSANPVAYVSLPYWSNGYNIYVSTFSGSSSIR